MTVEIKLFDDLALAADDAAGALDRAQQPSLYNRIDWFRRTVEHCPPAGKPLIARARNAKGAAWLFLAGSGAAFEALASWYTLEFGLVSIAEGAQLLPALVRKLHGIARVTFFPVAEPEPIAGAFREAGWFVFVSPASVNWQIRPPSTFDAFWQTRPSRLRNTVERKAKKAGLDIRIHRGFDAGAWADYRTIYESSWKPEEGSWGFMQDFAEAEGAAGTLRLGIAYRDGVPVAGQLWHVENGRATIHKLAYAESAKELSPGSILSAAMFRHVIDEDRPELIDYGTGDQPYKAEWMDTARPLHRIECFHPRRPAAWPGLAKRLLSSLVRRTANG
jgi:hypothetical protein